MGRRIAATDALCLITALLISYSVYWGIGVLPVSYLILVAVMPFIWIPLFRAYSLHRPQLLSSWDEFRRTISASGVGMVVVIMGSFWTKAALSRIWIGMTWVLVILLELVVRRAWRRHFEAERAAGRLSLRTVVVGCEEDSERIAGAIAGETSGFDLVGFVSPEPSPTGGEDLGDIDDLVTLIYDHAIDCIFIATPDLPERTVLKITQTARQQDIEVRVAANLPQILSPRLNVLPIESVMSLTLRPVQLTGIKAAVKRAFDLGITGFILLPALPVMGILALAIKFSSEGPILFRQHRVTKGGHIFNMLKFRTMRQDADEVLEKLDIDPSAPFFKLGEDDPRLTKIGKLLRKYSLDELPQLFNVMSGDMSLVGPRPLPAEQVAANLELLGPRHEVPAGVTGWWQVQGRSEVEDPDEAVRMDLFYIENWSLALDVYVLLKTFGAVLAKRGAV
jgi:exopolysaccharide biosynthesis polyprenyl glycosylphosphotransferase